MSVKLEEPQKIGVKPLYVDLGVRCLAAVWHEGLKQPIAFRGGELLSEWVYWTDRICEEQKGL